MPNHNIIAEFSNALLELLRQNMQDILPQANSIALCSPADHGDALLGIYLYDITKTKDFFGDMVTLDAAHRQMPSAFLTLHYMLTAYSSGESRYRSTEEQRILGKAMQVLEDNDTLSVSLLGNSNATLPEIYLASEDLNFEDKTRIFSALQLPWRTSLFYQAEPLELVSAETQKTARVTGISFGEKEA